MAGRDLRVQKTYNALTASFEQLMAEKRFDEITVAELCDRAMVRRATFYKHFSDKYDFFSFYVGELHGRFEATHPEDDDDPTEYFMSRISYLVDFLDEHHALVSSISRSPLMSTMLDILSEHIAQRSEAKFRELGEGMGTGVEVSLVATAFASALVGTVKWWYLGEEPMPRDEFLSQARTILSQVLPAHA